jgi:hypothetical protein
MATLKALLEQSDPIFEIGVYIDDEFSLDDATGKQEDVLGEIVGVGRVVTFQPAKGLSPVLDNEAYRQLLRSRIARNTWKGGVQDLQDTWRVLFGEGIIVQDNQDMTIDVVTIGLDSQIVQDMIQHGLIVPKPQSVGINYYFADDAVFGYDMETATIKGYDHANWMQSEPKPSFSYDTESETDGMLGYDEGYWT